MKKIICGKRKKLKKNVKGLDEGGQGRKELWKKKMMSTSKE